MILSHKNLSLCDAIMILPVNAETCYSVSKPWGKHIVCIKPLSSVSLNMSEQMNVSGDFSKSLSLCLWLKTCSEDLDDCAVFCLPLSSCLPVDVCVISRGCCKRQNEKGVVHSEHKPHPELWDVNCLTVDCLLPYIRPEELLTAIAICFHWDVTVSSLTSSTSANKKGIYKL